MARQPAIDIGVFPVVAFQTHSHAPVLERQALRVFDRTVAFPAGDFFVDMALVVEQHVFRYVIYLHPGRGGLRIEILMLLLNLRVIFNNIIVAVQTLFHRRDAREIGVSDRRVAVLTLNLFDSDMHIMAKGYGLLRTEPGRR